MSERVSRALKANVKHYAKFWIKGAYISIAKCLKLEIEILGLTRYRYKNSK